MKKKLLIFLLFFSFTLSAQAGTHYPDSYYENLSQRIEAALGKGKKKSADFWTARYLGASVSDPESQKKPKDLEAMIKKRAMAPASFISSEYAPDFIDWFVKSTYANWSVSEEHVREKSGIFEIQSIVYKDYFLTITAAPELQAWFVSGSDTTPLILAAGSSSMKPVIYCGKLINGKPTLYFPAVTLDFGNRRLLYVWKPEFYDLDGDNIPEVWVRYNATALNGFSQNLMIFKIENDNQLVLFKKFKSNFEGVAKRLEGNKILLGHGQGSKPNIPHMSYDLYRFETWEFNSGDFKKISEASVPHILGNKEWKRYYLDQ